MDGDKASNLIQGRIIEYGLLEAENTQVGWNSKTRKDHHERNKLELDARCKEVDNKRDKLVENGMQKHIEKYGGARLLLA